MALLDVNALVGLAWDSHVHHAAVRAWCSANRDGGWATCAVTESGFVRVSSNPKVLPSFIAVEAARGVLSALRDVGDHRFLANDVSLADADVPAYRWSPAGDRRPAPDAGTASRDPPGDLRCGHRRAGRGTPRGAADLLKELGTTDPSLVVGPRDRHLALTVDGRNPARSPTTASGGSTRLGSRVARYRTSDPAHGAIWRITRRWHGVRPWRSHAPAGPPAFQVTRDERR